MFLEFGGFYPPFYPLFCGRAQKRTGPKPCPVSILFLGAELVLAHRAEGALEIVTDFFPLLALFFFVVDPATDFADIFHGYFLLVILNE